jgi:hypothetical protein
MPSRNLFGSTEITVWPNATKSLSPCFVARMNRMLVVHRAAHHVGLGIQPLLGGRIVVDLLVARSA